jgi:hypothetical protein
LQEQIHYKTEIDGIYKQFTFGDYLTGLGRLKIYFGTANGASTVSNLAQELNG